jgi:hypothetical protein
LSSAWDALLRQNDGEMLEVEGIRTSFAKRRFWHSTK